MRITGDSPIKSSKLIRVKGITLFVVGVSTFYLYSRFVFDTQLKLWLEKELTDLNGAQVNIGSLESNLWKGKLVLKSLQFSSPSTPMRNAFQLDSITTQVSVAPLLRKKLHITEMGIEGFHYWTNRQEPGAYTFDLATGIMPASVMDRAASGIYSGIRNELTENPLRHLGQLGSGFAVQSKLGMISPKLASVQHLRNLLKTLKEKEPLWERQKSELPSPAAISGLKTRLTGSPQAKKILSQSAEYSPQEELKKRINEVRTHLEELTTDLSEISTQLSNTDRFLKSDIALIRRELGLPRTDYNDLTDLTFGPYWLSLLEKLSYWLEYSRKEAPVGTLNDSYTMTVLNRQGKRSVHFGKVGALPAFLLEKATIKSGKKMGGTEVKMQGELQGLTSDPALYGRPTLLDLTADYPEKEFRNLHLTVALDHTQKVPKENIHLTVDSFRLQNWPITRTSDIQLELAKAMAGLTLKGEFVADQIDFNWNVSVMEAEYGISSRFRQVEQTLQNMLTGLYSFDMNGKISGPVTALTFHSTSGLGEKLADGLKTEFRHEFGALDESISKETQTLFPPLKEAIQAQLRKHRDETEPAFQKALKDLLELNKSVEKNSSEDELS